MKYTGSCHCKRIQFVCEMELNQPTVCDCSYCAKRNAVLHIVDSVNVYAGSNSLSCYKFNKMKGEHFFCEHCGIFIYSTPPEPVYPHAVNLCALDSDAWKNISLYHFDGKSL